jgi:hypothetical protein
MNIDSGRVPMILIAPAWMRWGRSTAIKPGTVILHSEHDEVIPIKDSRELVRSSGLPDSALVVVGADHNMIDEDAFRALIDAIEPSQESGRQ